MHLFRLIALCLAVHSATAQGEYLTLDDGARLYVVEEGQGQAIVFIPGWTMTYRFFENQQSYFSKDYKTIAFDPRGQGRSDKIQYRNNYAAHANDLRQLFLQKGLDDVILVGWSSGCLAMYEYLRAFGTEKLQKLVFIDEPPKWIGDKENEWVYGTFDGYRSGLKEMLSRPSDPNGIIDWMLVDPVDDDTRAWMNEEIKLTSPEVALNLYIDGLAADYNAELSLLSEIPSLFMVRDSWYSEVADWMAIKAPTTEVTDIPSHAAFWERPKSFNAKLESFVNGEELTTASNETSSNLIRKGDLLLPRYAPTAATDGESIYVYGGAPSGGRNGDDFMHAGLHATIEKINPESLSSEYLSGGLYRRANHATVFLDGELISCGGRSQIGLERPRLASCESMNLSTGIHRKLPDLPEALRTLGMTLVNGDLYVIGGLTQDGKYSDRTYRLQNGAQAWEKLANAPMALEGQMQTIESDIYVIGGYNGQAMNTVMVYSTDNNQWSMTEQLPYGLSAYSAVVYDNSIYIFGDYEQMDAIHRYDVVSGELNLLDQKMTPRRHTAAVLIGDEAFVIGGNQTSSGKALTIVESFDLSKVKL
ncbi:MAG: alpha/beta fold hydrolase [Bacteroidota bacterium]